MPDFSNSQSETEHPVHLSGMEPELSAGLTGDEPMLGGDLREWSSIVAHLFSDQQDALRAGDKDRLRVIRRLRARIWREADEENWRRYQESNRLTGSVALSRWRSSPELGDYKRPVYDKINDRAALTAVIHELEEARAALAQAEAYDRQDLVREHEAASAIIEAYVERWQKT